MKKIIKSLNYQSNYKVLKLTIKAHQNNFLLNLINTIVNCYKNKNK